SALTSTYECETMTWSGTEGVDGQHITSPAPAHLTMWTNGYVYQPHAFTGGSTTISIRARGDLAAGTGPHIVVTVAGVQFGETPSRQWGLATSRHACGWHCCPKQNHQPSGL